MPGMTDRTPLDSLKPLAGRALEAALNRALALDPDTREALRALDGRRVVVRLSAPALALQIQVCGDRLGVGPVEDGEADLSVRTSLGGLLAQLPFFRRDDAPPVGQLRIEGDAELARRLQRLAERFDPDWQQPFVAVFGEVIGVQVAQAAAATLRHAQGAATSFAQTTAEYLTEESRDLVPRAELEAFYDDVDALRDDVERLAARVARLRMAAGGGPGSTT
ncbi:MAG TPA: SCP2 sterol-binding domain-containing protein [Lysobacter sp.]|nr:SCP2 sterol-binding domain-containing protein [Lysobacter sp.]